MLIHEKITFLLRKVPVYGTLLRMLFKSVSASIIVYTKMMYSRNSKFSEYFKYLLTSYTIEFITDTTNSKIIRT